MSSPPSPHDDFVRYLARRTRLSPESEAAVRALPLRTVEYSPSAYLLREGQLPLRCDLLIEGFAYRQKLTAEGQRAIVAVLVPGDFTDSQSLFLREADHDVQALTALTVVEVALADLRELARTHSGVGEAIYTHALVEASIGREWLLNVGRRDARARTAHLLCEMSARLEGAGMSPEQTYILPMTQEQLGDAMGLTSVHVNRVLKGLEGEGLIRRRKRELAIVDWQRLRRAADFNPRYLHFGLQDPG